MSVLTNRTTIMKKAVKTLMAESCITDKNYKRGMEKLSALFNRHLKGDLINDRCNAITV